MSRTIPRPPRWFPVATLAIVIAFVTAALLLSRPGPGAPAPWARLGTQDVHSLAFVGDDSQHLLFGHHNGIAESRDGGRTWAPLPVGEDAMGMVAADDGSIVIAGHLVFTASRDGGQTWAPISTDLPSLDIHGFTRDPSDPARMWAYLATGGLWESRDFGARFTRIRDDNVLYPTAVAARTGTRLFGVDASGLIVSDDGGRTWMALGQPPTYPMTAFAASADGTVLYAGAPDGLFRSGDGGRTWSATGYTSSAFAVATTPDGQSVGVVSQATEFFRSSDSGATWPGEE